MLPALYGFCTHFMKVHIWMAVGFILESLLNESMIWSYLCYNSYMGDLCVHTSTVVYLYSLTAVNNILCIPLSLAMVMSFID